MLDNPRTFAGGLRSGARASPLVQINFLKAGEGVGEPERPEAPVMCAGESFLTWQRKIR